MKNEIPYKTFLSEDELPRAWYNVRAVMPEKCPPLLNPATRQPVTVEELSQVFCEELARQELDDVNEFIPIPDEVLNFYKMFRPSPLVRSRRLGPPPTSTTNSRATTPLAATS